MIETGDLAPRLELFFTERLMAQRQASPHTIGAYRDTFRLFLRFAQKRLGKAPATLTFSDIDAPLIDAFLVEQQTHRNICSRSRNLRLTSLRSFFTYAAYFEPAHAGRIQQILAIPAKRHDRRQVSFLTRPEIEAVLNAPDRKTWIGRRDHAWLLIAFQTGMRLSEMTGLAIRDVELGTGPYIHCTGKGRKERCTPLTRSAVNVLKSWINEPCGSRADWLFPTVQQRRMSPDAVQHFFAKHSTAAAQQCPSLSRMRVTPHVARHTAAMELLQAGIDLSVIALWLGHESINTTHIYLEANLALKEAALDKVNPIESRGVRFTADDRLMAFLSTL